MVNNGMQVGSGDVPDEYAARSMRMKGVARLARLQRYSITVWA